MPATAVITEIARQVRALGFIGEMTYNATALNLINRRKGTTTEISYDAARDSYNVTVHTVNTRKGTYTKVEHKDLMVESLANFF